MNDAKNFESIRHIATPEDINLKLNELESLHLVLIAPEYKVIQIENLVKAIRAKQIAKNSAVVLLLDHDSSSDRDMWIEAGIDAFVTAPYTVDTFSNLIGLTMRIVQERGLDERREELKRSLESFFSQLNLVALNLRTESDDLNINRKMLRLSGKSLMMLAGDNEDFYFEVVYSLMTDPKRQTRRLSYHGASHRVRKRYEKKLEQQLSQGLR
jgi:DNA-binding response OmpR family regulator